MSTRLRRLAPLALLALSACSQAGADVAFVGSPPTSGPAATAATVTTGAPTITAPTAQQASPTSRGRTADERPPGSLSPRTAAALAGTDGELGDAPTAGRGGGPLACAGSSAGTQAPPVGLIDELRARLADPRLAGTTVAASISMQGYGEILALNPDRPMVPASNQKLFTALGALAVLPPDARLITRVVATGPVEAGVVQGDLVLVGGGDPTITATDGPNSLTALTMQLLDAGVRGIAGRVVADESRYPPAREAPGWQPGDVPESSGPLSALIVDENRYRWDPAFLADPALANADLFRQVLTGGGVAVSGPAATGRAPDEAHTLASLASPTVTDLVTAMLQDSDNEIAEILTREAGLATSGVGTTASGALAMADALGPGCLRPGEVWADGSGLSRDDRTSARTLRTLLQAAIGSVGWPVLEAGLPVAGRSGTLVHRLRGTPAEGVAHAKTGYLVDAQALTGELTTAGGRAVVFSIIVNGTAPGDSIAAIDDTVVVLASDRS